MANGQLQAGALSVFAISCMLATAVVITQVFTRLGEYGTANQDNIQWTISRLEVDQLNFIATIERLDRPDAALLDTLRRRFDVLYSRATLLHDGQVYREVLSTVDVMADISLIVATLNAMVPVIDNSNARLFSERATLMQRATDMSPAVHRIASRALTVDARRSDAERSELTSQIVVLTVLSLAMVTALLMLLLFVWRLYTEHRRRAEENRETSRRLATILNTSQDAVLVVGPDGIIRDRNVVANRMFAIPSDAPRHVRVGDFLHRREADGNLVPLTGERLIACCANGPSRCANLMVRNTQGDEFCAEISTAIARSGATTVCICFIRDISDRLAAEAEIAAARDRALSGERARARFLSVISHEMRTPLSGLLGALDLLGETRLTPDQARYANVMKSSGQLLLTQITDALDMAQAETGQLVLRMAEFDLDRMLRELAETQKAAAQARNNQLRLVCSAPDLNRVRGDRTRVYQVLLNLVSNAIKFTRDGEITIIADRTDPSGDGPDMVEFQICDTGIGINPEDMPQMFEDFVRLDDPESDRPEGTGLGLGIVRELVTLMGGSVGAESVKGEGSLFWVRIPLPAVTMTETAARPCAPLDVLVVEDNANSRVVLEAMLREDGHRVRLASDGIEGVAHAAEARHDLILMDINMPRMGGLEAVRRIRAGSGPSARTRIIALTAHCSPDIETALRGGYLDGVETKPLRRETLRAILAHTGPDAPPQPAATCVDASVLSQLSESLPPARITQLLDQFATEGSALLADLDRLWQAPPGALSDRLHAFAGSAATTGALALHRLLSRAETALRADDRGTAQDLLQDLPGLMEKTLAQIDARHHAA
ncbi:Signal transduction histidine kinase [Roseovarius azorensis]|uniref:histidine kinase n=1 Tax=Roseovarius azorensis TaxID=1287727 RepID=A0A1H7LE90_9RHOB|nr:PAS domain-containing hybrid sensor histidine kinase/response regulator [Roseovarius azorensis]SEK97219.1 Signal transduction histidine kinase [Roseovarius azorensis]